MGFFFFACMFVLYVSLFLDEKSLYCSYNVIGPGLRNTTSIFLKFSIS